ncbi:MAG TPA: hypothetical protein DIC42_04565 [Holosporales bacterium]|nr:hypothetical protein [Holosporales bacterium]
MYATRPLEDSDHVSTTWKDELSALDGKVADLEKKFGYLRAIDISLDIIVGATEYDKTSLRDPIFKALFPNLVDYYQFFSDFGVIEMQNSLGCLLLKNSDDRAGALKYLKMAVVNGHKHAHHNYATALSEAGFSEDAFFYFQIAADYGSIVAQYNCATILVNGIGVARDTKKAFKYFKLAAENGFKEAQFSCALMLDRGEGVVQDYTEALIYFKRAADQGHRDAQFICGEMLHKRKGVVQDYTEAFKYYKMAADQGHVRAQYECGMFLKKQFLGTDDAVMYCKMAADQGHVEAQYECGMLLYSGEGIAVNKVEAFKYFEMAANQHHAIAQYNCGLLLFEGEGVPESKLEATVYFIRAARQGNLDAINKMNQLMPDGSWDMPRDQALNQ